VEMMDDPLFAGISRLVVYYANSYVADLSDGSEAIGWTRYGDELFPAVVRRDTVWGVQFHPEKSGASGLQLLGNFLSLVRG
jgi:imidazole glycerol-phosphate synthase subunit HisH